MMDKEYVSLQSHNGELYALSKCGKLYQIRVSGISYECSAEKVMDLQEARYND